MKSNALAGVVILYYPDKDVFNNINNYIDALDYLIIYDNSPSNESYISLLQGISSKVEYFFNGCNDGIAEPLNFAVSKVIEKGYNYLLTMDQDSEFYSKDVNKLFRLCDKKNKNIAIYAPKVIFKNSNLKETRSEQSTEHTNFVITSGNILDVNLVNEIGGFDENLFIDGVDRDLCLRVIDNKLNILVSNDSLMLQELGSGKINLLKIAPHSPIRNYYIARNRRYIIHKYPAAFSRFAKIRSLYLSELKQVVSILIFEREKKEKIIMFYRGICDFKRKKVGCYEKDF